MQRDAIFWYVKFNLIQIQNQQADQDLGELLCILVLQPTDKYSTLKQCIRVGFSSLVLRPSLVFQCYMQNVESTCVGLGTRLGSLTGNILVQSIHVGVVWVTFETTSGLPHQRKIDSVKARRVYCDDGTLGTLHYIVTSYNMYNILNSQ